MNGRCNEKKTDLTECAFRYFIFAGCLAVMSFFPALNFAVSSNSCAECLSGAKQAVWDKCFDSLLHNYDYPDTLETTYPEWLDGLEFDRIVINIRKGDKNNIKLGMLLYMFYKVEDKELLADSLKESMISAPSAYLEISESLLGYEWDKDTYNILTDYAVPDDFDVNFSKLEKIGAALREAGLTGNKSRKKREIEDVVLSSMENLVWLGRSRCGNPLLGPIMLEYAYLTTELIIDQAYVPLGILYSPIILAYVIKDSSSPFMQWFYAGSIACGLGYPVYVLADSYINRNYRNTARAWIGLVISIPMYMIVVDTIQLRGRTDRYDNYKKSLKVSDSIMLMPVLSESYTGISVLAEF